MFALIIIIIIIIIIAAAATNISTCVYGLPSAISEHFRFKLRHFCLH
jgi:hypothetical protein